MMNQTLHKKLQIQKALLLLAGLRRLDDLKARSDGIYRRAEGDTPATDNITNTPGPNEAGLYSVWAIHPDLSDRTVQAQFSIIGMEVSPLYANIRMLKRMKGHVSTYDRF